MVRSWNPTKVRLFELYRKFDLAGFFGLVRGGRRLHLQLNPFGMHKDEVKDRLVLDCRGVNGAECRIAGGAASSIFPGYRFAELRVRRFVQGLRASGSDRKDMYYQCQVSSERAARYIVGPPCDEKAFASFPLAFTRLRASEADRTSPASRPVSGDLFLLARDRAFSY